MKKLVLCITTFYFSFAVLAQDLISKIPSDAAAVVTIKGKKVTDLVSLEDFSNSKLGQMLGEQLDKESKGKITDLKNVGFDFNRNFYYFLDVKENVFTSCFLVPLNNAENFKSFLSESRLEGTVNESGYSYVQDDYDGAITMWTDNTLILMFSKDQSPSNEDYGYDYYDNDYSHIESEVLESTEPADYSITVESVEPSDAVVDATFGAKDAAGDAKDASMEAAAAAVTEAVEDASEEVVDETEVITEIEVVEDEESNDDYRTQREIERQANREKREAEREKQRIELAVTTLARAKEVLAANYAQGSILRNSAYMKSVGKGDEEASAWIGDFGKIYLQAFPDLFGLYGGMGPYSYMDVEKMYGGMTMVAKLDFDEDNVALRTEYTVDEQMAQWYSQMYDGKFNSKFSNYLNEDRLLAYWSMNMSVEGMLKAYPGLIESLFQSNEDNIYSDGISLGVDLFSILIDEEGAAEIIRGDALLALTDLSERTVTYTDYEYDEEFNRKEIEKTKTETVPDFLFMFTSEQKKIYDKLVRIGLREGELEAMNGIYKIKSAGSSAPFDIYMHFKDDMFLMGSSKRDMMAIASGTFNSKLSSNHKRNMRKNVTSMYVNGKKIIAQVPTDLYPSELRDKVGFLTQNTEDVYFNFEKMKGNTMRGEMIWNTATSGHQNSFDYFLNMIETLVGDAR